MTTNPLRAIASDRHRYALLMTTAVTAWTVTVALVLLRVAHVLPQQWGTLATMTTGIGVASSVALNRLKLAYTLIDVFRAGRASAARPPE